MDNKQKEGKRWCSECNDFIFDTPIINYCTKKGLTLSVLDKGYVRLVDWMGTDSDIVEAARVSYKSPSKGPEQDKKLLNYLWKNRHTSPFEQVSIKFNIKLPLFVQGHIVRHRTQKLNQVSARYTEMPDEFYIPDKWRRQDIKNKQGSIEDDNWNPIFKESGWSDGIFRAERISYDVSATELLEKHCKKLYVFYKQMLEKGIAREMARMVLPQNLYTEVYTTWDLHNLLHFLTLRMDEHTQWETRQYATAMYTITKLLFPVTIEAFDKYKWKVVEQNT